MEETKRKSEELQKKRRAQHDADLEDQLDERGNVKITGKQREIFKCIQKHYPTISSVVVRFFCIFLIL